MTLFCSLSFCYSFHHISHGFVGFDQGAESVVYEAILDGKRVAVKKPILSTSDELDKFHKELQLLCKLHHPGIATLVAAHARPPNYMFFFQFYEERNLAHKLHVQEWTPDIDHALTITLQLGTLISAFSRISFLLSCYLVSISVFCFMTLNYGLVSLFLSDLSIFLFTSTKPNHMLGDLESILI